MVQIVVVSGVEDGVVGGQPRCLVSPVQVNAIHVEEGTVGEEHHVHVDGDDHGEQEQGKRAEELVDVLIGDDGERRGVEEDVVVLVEVPESGVDVAETVVAPLPEVRNERDEEKLDKDANSTSMIGVSERVAGAVGFGVAGLGEVNGDRRGDCRRIYTLGGLDDFVPNLLRARELGVSFPLPLF